MTPSASQCAWWMRRGSTLASWRTATGTSFPSPKWSTTAPASAASRGWMLVMHTSASKMSTWRARSGATARPSPITGDLKKPKRTSLPSGRPNPCSRPWTNPNTNLCRKLRSTLPERPSVGAVIDEHNHTIGGRRDDVALAVLVEIAHGDRVADAAGGDRLRCPECSVALAQEHQHLGGDVGAHRQIEIAIPIEGAGPHRYRSISGRIVHGRLKRAVAVSGQHGHIVRGQIGDRQVGLAIVVEIVRDQCERLISYRHFPPTSEGAVAVSQKDVD